MHSRPPRPERAIPRWGVFTMVGVGAFFVVTVVVAASAFVVDWTHQVTATAPAVGTVIVAPEESKAALALPGLTEGTDDYAATAYLAAQPTAYWLTPEIDPLGEVGARTESLIAQARAEGLSVAMVVYGLPERDCGAGLSAGGLDPAGYSEWTQQIGDALAGAPDVMKIVIVEPDALALGPECGNTDARMIELRMAITNLASTNTWLYVDGGHSDWLAASQMAELINQLGMNDIIRGFATNVSNYNQTYDEFEYAHALSEATGGLHAVIDTSRNGAGSNGEWCNPPGRLVGDPGGTYGDDVVDTNFWIKPPGESDGTCNGGPTAGAWWPEAAVELTRTVLP
ncbi:glycoside hydrolase family 6 protein [Microbacterium sediminicola]|uniref:Glucanase n=1 Tax=Microbacterium sediminicola TaxID=415210 RepID=A0ABN2ILB4_9MICO